MRNKNKADLLLIEIIIAVFFLMISLTVLVQIFAAARNQSARAAAETEALAEAQNVGEVLLKEENTEEYLKNAGFVLSHGVFTKDYGSFSLSVKEELIPKEAGTLRMDEVRGFYSFMNPDDAHPQIEELFMFPYAMYLSAGL
jgi:type II secretory pathway pseudopilin PulG